MSSIFVIEIQIVPDKCPFRYSNKLLIQTIKNQMFISKNFKQMQLSQCEFRKSHDMAQ